MRNKNHDRILTDTGITGNVVHVKGLHAPAKLLVMMLSKYRLGAGIFRDMPDAIECDRQSNQQFYPLDWGDVSTWT